MPDLPPIGALEPPADLKGAGRAEWVRLAQPLADAGILTDADRGAFTDLCRAITDLEAHERAARRLGVERSISSGVTGAVMRLRTQVSHLRVKFGLVPSARVRVPAKKNATGKLAAFISRSKDWTG